VVVVQFLVINQEIDVLDGSDGWTESELIPVQSWIQQTGTLVVARNQSGVARESSIFLRFKVSVPNLIDLNFAAIHLTPSISSTENLNTRIYLLDLEDASQEDWSSSGFDVNALPLRAGAVVDWTIGAITQDVETETPSILSLVSTFMARSDFNPDKYIGIEIAWDERDLTSTSLFEFNDSFDRITFGSDWNVSSSAIIDGTRVHSNSNTSQCIYTSALLSTNYEVSVDFYLNFTPSGVEDISASIFVRKNDNVVPFVSDTYYEIQFTQNLSSGSALAQVNVLKIINGTSTQVGSFVSTLLLETFLDHRYSVFVETKTNSVNFDIYQDNIFIGGIGDTTSSRILSGKYVGFQVEDLSGSGIKSSTANNFTARDTIGTSDLFKTFYSTEHNTLTPWLEIRVNDKLPLDIYWPIDVLTITSISSFRLCLAPGESTTGTLDLTPSVRIDKLGVRTGEIPLPIQLKRNNTYFIRLLGVDSTGAQDFVVPQNTSISCSECSNEITTWNFESCSLKFVIFNSFGDERYYNIKCIFYYDKEKKQKSAEFFAFPDSPDLQCFTLGENTPAESAWTDRGHLIASSDSSVIVLWPHLSPTSGLICGIKYYVDIFKCSVFEHLNNTICTEKDLKLDQSQEWRCNCESLRWDPRFENAPVNIREVSKWKSSGGGVSDTRITESLSINNLNPVIRMRSTFNGIIVYETNRTSESPEARNDINLNTYKIYASVFSIIPNYDMYASGAQYIHTESNNIVHRSDIPICKTTDSNSGSGYQSGANCFDDNGNRILSRTLEGRSISLEIDHYDGLFISADQLNNQEECEVFEKGKQSIIIVHRGGADDLDLFLEPTTLEEIAKNQPCKSTVLTEQNFAITAEDDFFSIVQKIRVHNDDVKYHTTHKGIVAPVVDKCDITLVIVGTPESVAVHLKNRPGDDWSEWHAFEPKIGENAIEIEWSLDPGSGIKNIHVQVSTYTGITQTAILIVIADYNTVSYEISFFKPLSNTPFPTSLLQDFSVLDSTDIWVDSNKLNDINNIPVAALRPNAIGGSDFIFVEIIPNIIYMKQFSDTSSEDKSSGNISPTFDFVQQGSKDVLRSTTTYNKSDDGVESFRGYIVINKSDNSMFVDGFASIIPNFRNDCSNSESLNVGHVPEPLISYSKDIYNVVISGDKSEVLTDVTDVWSGERTSVGEIKNPIVIRPNEDPYLIFGDPKYRLKKENEDT